MDSDDGGPVALRGDLLCGVPVLGGRAVFVERQAFFRQLCLQANNEEEDCTEYEENSDGGSHGILHLSSGRSPGSVYGGTGIESVMGLTSDIGAAATV